MKPRLLTPWRHAAMLTALAAVAGCAGTPDGPPEEPTLKELAGRQPVLQPERALHSTPAQAIAAYDAFLARLPAGTEVPERREAMRRLADLEMDRADEASARSGEAPDFKAAIARYQAVLKSQPQASDNDRVLYQLARAQEQSGDLPTALATLDRLVSAHPGSDVLAEAQFRRGEMLFNAGRHVEAERAFGVVLQAGPESTFQQRALYMRGWARFKQGQPAEALQDFFGVLDDKLGGHAPGEQPALTRADRELLEDTFRVSSLSLQSLDGARSIPAYMGAPGRDAYEPRVYTELAALYLRQERIKDAADTLSAFADQHPLHAQAPVLLSQVIAIDEKAGFASLALRAKKDFVTRYGADSALRDANHEGWQAAQPLVKTHLAELARHHHALAQQQHRPEDVREAANWYRQSLQAFPDDADAAQSRFLLAELLFEDQRWAEAGVEYERAAYDHPPHARSAEAGYAVLLAQARLEAAAPQDAALRQQGVARELRFAAAFPADGRAAAVLTHAADRLFALGDPRAPEVARQVLALEPPADADQRRVAWTVLAHSAFEQQQFADAEAAYREVLALTPAQGTNRAALDERLAAAVYKQGEAARSAGDLKAAVGHFERIAALPSDGPADGAVRASAQFDAGAAQIALKDWPAAARTLEDFRRRYPRHPLAAELPPKLAAVYLAQQQWAPAAAELERIAATQTDPAAARDALWQAGELYDKAGAAPDAARAWERYVTAYAQPLEPAVLARQRLADLARARGDGKAALAWTQALQQADRAGGDARTERTRALGAQAALALAEPVFEAYRQVRLVAPLQRQLKLKKTRLEQALQACAQVADYGQAEAVTAAAFHSAALYQDFGRALLASERPRKLSKAELEQYTVMLEEQAFPFEEKAIDLYTANARRAADGVWNDWVGRSFEALATLQPGRYARPERGDTGAPPAAQPADAAGWTALGLAHRRHGRLNEARDAYLQALALEPAHADALFDLAVLHELYLGDGAAALPWYQRYLALQPGGDAAVQKWVALIEREHSRKTASAQTAGPAPTVAPGAPMPRKETP